MIKEADEAKVEMDYKKGLDGIRKKNGRRLKPEFSRGTRKETDKTQKPKPGRNINGVRESPWDEGKLLKQEGGVYGHGRVGG